MRPVAFGEALPAGTRLTLFSDDKPDRFLTIIKFWTDATSGAHLTSRWRATNYFDDRHDVGVRTEETLYLSKVAEDFFLDE